MTDPNKTSDHLTHLVYDASLDNALWPELMIELTEYLQQVGSSKYIMASNSQDMIHDLSTHFRRAFEISERMVSLQEREADLQAVLDTVVMGLALVNDAGDIIFQNKAMKEHLTTLRASPSEIKLLKTGGDQTADALPINNWVETCNRNEQPQVLALPGEAEPNLIMLPRLDATRMGFPARAAAVLLYSDVAKSDGFRAFSAMHCLTRQEKRLTALLFQTGDLRASAKEMGISYESSRTYLKRVYDKTGCKGQAELISSMVRVPTAGLLGHKIAKEETHHVRRTCTLQDGRILEYFELGPAQGTPVLHFDALSGITIDVVGFPTECLKFLEQLNIRLITPSRPGCFRSDMKMVNSLTELVPDIVELLDHLNIDRFSVCSVSYGVGIALALAHQLGDRIDKVSMSSVNYPKYKHPNWKELDLFYQMSGVLARYWPSMFRQIIPFLIRSILQNVDGYFERTLGRAKSPQDIALLSNPVLRSRTASMLMERTVLGMDGMVEENLLNARGWDFDVKNIQTPIEIIQGELDNVTPVGGAVLLAKHLPFAKLTTLPEAGHYHHIMNWPVLLARSIGKEAEIGSMVYNFMPN